LLLSKITTGYCARYQYIVDVGSGFVFIHFSGRPGGLYIPSPRRFFVYPLAGMTPDLPARTLSSAAKRLRAFHCHPWRNQLVYPS
jgi:hypothetical protein